MPTCPNTQSLVLLGGGGHALVVADAADRAGSQIRGVYDDADLPLLVEARPGIPRLGPLGDLGPASLAGEAWIIAVGELGSRRRLVERLGTDGAAELIHPSAIISASATIEPGTFIGPGAIINAGAHIRAHAIINTGSIIEHGCEIGGNAHIAPGAVLGGDVRVGADTLIGLGSRVLPGVTIGHGCTIGAGAVVVRDIQPGTTAVGCPAGVLNDISSRR
ncbi:MAG TPA: acetyltransferase [Phycisphaerales bacterium]|nr:acetyltransferase [Phycisphaerales bacterium]